ncbi:MAG: hypothetical protein HOD35_01240 [Euryarchaeota archaeon]|nr:hypothetical protein [Euryarchaeota archaeon]
MNSLIAIISSILIFIGAVLIIKPKNKSVPEIWELGTDEVDKEDNFISKDDDFDLQIMSPVPDSKVTNYDVYEDANFEEEIIQNENINPSEVENELLIPDEDMNIMDELNQMADGLDLDELNQMAKNLEKENIDTSFLDEMLDDQ